MNKIIIFIGHYLPGYKAGGPISTIKNYVDTYYDKCEFYIVCNDRDLGDQEPYKNVVLNEWNQTKQCKIFYTKLSNISSSQLLKLCSGMDFIYCCGTYDKYARLLCKLRKKELINNLYVASMGNFSPNAFKIKTLKKKMFFLYAKLVGLFSKIVWSFTSNDEMEYAKTIFKRKLNYVIIHDIPQRPFSLEPSPKDDSLRVVFISRICRMKNLFGSIKALMLCKSKINFSIFGSLEDLDYWSECQNLLSMLPSNISWKYCGDITPSEVVNTFNKNDLFLFLTNGENFGHVIYEALLGGCVPIISEKTPWVFSPNTGFIVDNNDFQKIAEIIDSINCEKPENLLKRKKDCSKYAFEKYNAIVKDNLFYSEFVAR